MDHIAKALRLSPGVRSRTLYIYLYHTLMIKFNVYKNRKCGFNVVLLKETANKVAYGLSNILYTSYIATSPRLLMIFTNICFYSLSDVSLCAAQSKYALCKDLLQT